MTSNLGDRWTWRKYALYRVVLVFSRQTDITLDKELKSRDL